MRKEKGSALITVILVTLVLTMVGLAAMLFMSVENTMSANDQGQKEALYLAETGLRAAESKIGSLPVDSSIINSQLEGNSYSTDGTTAPQSLQYCTGYAYPGVVLTSVSASPGSQAFGPNFLASVPVSYTPLGSTSDRTGYYTVYIRNNPQDYSGSCTIDGDGFVEVVSVGQVLAAGQVKYEKILQETFFLGLGGQGTNWVLQKGLNAGGTNAGMYK